MDLTIHGWYRNGCFAAHVPCGDVGACMYAVGVCIFVCVCVCSYVCVWACVHA